MNGEQPPHKFGTRVFKRDDQPESKVSVLRSANPALRRITPPAPPAPRDLASSIQDSAAEIAIVWMLHRLTLTKRQQGEPLDQQIKNFSATAFDAIVTRFPGLQGTKKEHLWLIYFKGLLAAATPARDQILEAIRAIRLENEVTTRRSTAAHRPKLTAVPKAIGRAPRTAPSDLDALEQISRALSEKDTNSF